ncbi:VWA domain-containing protein [Nitratiruptor sp. YY09-18]|uniref:VWA domain-containing protein n=1 Tax=Nitratiruptor sp. YY09-18 TaxID=2724901 RepID=UPI001916BF55|nr:VWA domain-containing protein [Nitratiruptor sp. YY09-18]BCD68897.1 Ca-activated chloride channel homolog [Nitratiruptor sp. YY09-18]
MSFLYPWVLWLIVPALLLLLLSKEPKFAQIFNPKIIIEAKSMNPSWLPLILVLVIIALARPVINKPLAASKSATPLFIALDFSASMQAQDIKPNRLQKAKDIASKLIERSPSPTSILIFTSNPLIIAPPTTDKEALLQILQSIDEKGILTKGTDFGKLLEFIGKFAGKKNLVILSDGGEFSDPQVLQEYAKQHNITIFSIGVATKEGALIPTKNGYLKYEGKLVISRLNPAFTKLGTYLEPDEAEKVFDLIESRLQKTTTKKQVELYFVPLFVAFLLYIWFATTLFDTIKKLPFFVLLAVTLHAGVVEEFALQKGYKELEMGHYKRALEYLQKSKTFESRFLQGVALCKLGKIRRAIEIFRHLHTTDTNIKAKIYYNLGYCYEKMRKFEDALQSYIHAYQLRQEPKTMQKIEQLVFKKNQKKLLLPFSKQKQVAKRGNNSKNGGKSAGSANVNIAVQSGAAKGGKKQKGGALSKRGETMPMSSKVYELINRGYIDEKRPW